MGPDPDEEEVEDVRLDKKRESQWKIFFEENDGGLENQKVILHNESWDVYMNDKGALIKGEYFVEVSGSDGERVIWEVVDDHVVEEGKNHDEIGLRGIDLIFLAKTSRGLLEKD